MNIIHVQRHVGISKGRRISSVHHGPDHKLWSHSIWKRPTRQHIHSRILLADTTRPWTCEDGSRCLFSQVLSLIAATPSIFQAIEAELGADFRRQFLQIISLTSPQYLPAQLSSPATLSSRYSLRMPREVNVLSTGQAWTDDPMEVTDSPDPSTHSTRGKKSEDNCQPFHAICNRL